MEDETPQRECPSETDDRDGETFDASALPVETECTVTLPDDLGADLEDYCRARYVHREEAIRSLLADWLDRRPE